MPDLTWGMLKKSAVDPETIEQAIARMIREHNDDEESHLGPGQSLQSHKASEIIDHLARSIVTDKLADKAVTFRKAYEDRFVFRAGFESLDAWQQSQSGSGGGASLFGGFLKLSTPYGNGAYAIAYLETIIINADPRKDIIAWVSGLLAPEAGLFDAALMWGNANPFDSNIQGFGFILDGTPQKLYARSRSYSGEIRTEIQGVDPYRFHAFSCETSNDGRRVEFFIDGVSVAIHNHDNYIVDSEFQFSAGVRNRVVDPDSYLGISNYVFSQEW